MGAAGLAPSAFREYDIRGVVGSDLTAEGAGALGRGLARLLAEDGAGGETVAVGRDHRPSSRRLLAGLVEGLREGGCPVVDCGMVTTPMLYFTRIARQLRHAVMVTGSHNPPQYNGFKLVAHGHALHGPQIRRLAGLCRGGGPSPLPLASYERARPFPAYRRALGERIRLAAGFRPTVVVDAGNGSAGPFAPRVLTDWGCRTVELYCRPGAPGGHHPDPTVPANLDDLRAAVRSTGADLGIAFDGDGDRLGVVDAHGETVHGDQLMALFWDEVLAARPGAPALVEVKCSDRLAELVAARGGRVIWCRTGHSLVKARMAELGAPFAGEFSGHFYFADEYYGFDDALYAAGRLLRLLGRAGAGRPLHELVAPFRGGVATPELRVPCPDARKRGAVTRFRAAMRRRGYPVITVDGARVRFPGGWGLVRASNTEPALVIRCEGADAEAFARIRAEMREALLAAGIETDPFGKGDRA